uniref:Protein m136 n=1 Tax=Mastomys natalensis cytomegalovirus 1 TaxID=2973541 RepID=A0A9Y1IL13_9BETA|nr:protein m136 [Mastomys natalensis cytomegalovirus 1]WEG68985.1 protein m136 [Mastomys natalensis cytomegalovirus 1]WEG71213.1 protein m136 [Mastomys natalensis cytomegalovirus 1]
MAVTNTCRLIKILLSLSLLSYLLNSTTSQVIILAYQTRLSTTCISRNIIKWYWRSTTRFVSMEVSWDRMFYETVSLYKTDWTRFTTNRTVTRKIGNEDITIDICRFDPDEKGIEELHVQFNGTINHEFMGTLSCMITTEDGKSLSKSVTIDMAITCQLYYHRNSTIYECDPTNHGWLRGPVEVTAKLNNVTQGRLLTTEYGFQYIEYTRGSVLSCYLGPGGPIVAITMMIRRCGDYELEIVIKKKYIVKRRFNID